jgi:tRNA-dihydrouridine synthase
MVGRAAQGRPWLPGQIARYLTGTRCEVEPALAMQHRLIDELYQEMLVHHGSAVGTRHARKHLGWALDVAAATAGAATDVLREQRTRVLTCDDAARVRRHLADAFDAFGTRQRAVA